MCVSTCYKHSTYRVGQIESTQCRFGTLGADSPAPLRGLNLFSGLSQDFRLDWRPGLRPGLFSFAPSGLEFGGGWHRGGWRLVRMP
jgi:hypothetical protein